jgi:hypothetical protein
MDIEQVLNLETIKPSIMPPVNSWLADAKVKLQDHFDQRTTNFPVYDRAVVVRN